MKLREAVLGFEGRGVVQWVVGGKAREDVPSVLEETEQISKIKEKDILPWAKTAKEFDEKEEEKQKSEWNVKKETPKDDRIWGDVYTKRKKESKQEFQYIPPSLQEVGVHRFPFSITIPKSCPPTFRLCSRWYANSASVDYALIGHITYYKFKSKEGWEKKYSEIKRRIHVWNATLGYLPPPLLNTDKIEESNVFSSLLTLVDNPYIRYSNIQTHTN